MLDRSKCKKELVWDEPNDKLKKIVIEKHSDYCTCVYGCDEDSFNNNGVFRMVKWDHYESQPKKPVTNLDIMWRAGIRDVCRYENNVRFFCVTNLDCIVDITDWQFNTLVKADGVVKLLGNWETAEEFMEGES